MEKEKLVVHIARSSLAGAPIRIVNALNKYTKFSARLINFIPLSIGNEYMFPEDLNWQNQNDKIEGLDLIQKADIIHFHHYLDLRMNPLLIDFEKEVKPSCKFIRHFHSAKSFVNKTEIRFDENYAKDDLQKMVIPHCPGKIYLKTVHKDKK